MHLRQRLRLILNPTAPELLAIVVLAQNSMNCTFDRFAMDTWEAARLEVADATRFDEKALGRYLEWVHSEGFEKLSKSRNPYDTLRERIFQVTGTKLRTR